MKQTISTPILIAIAVVVLVLVIGFGIHYAFRPAPLPPADTAGMKSSGPPPPSSPLSNAYHGPAGGQ